MRTVRVRSRRRQFHRRVGEAIEVLFPTRLEDEADRLAYHFKEAGDDRRALKYYTMAGDRAMRTRRASSAASCVVPACSASVERAQSGRQISLPGRVTGAVR